MDKARGVKNRRKKNRGENLRNALRIISKWYNNKDFFFLGEGDDFAIPPMELHARKKWKCEEINQAKKLKGRNWSRKRFALYISNVIDFTTHEHCADRWRETPIGWKKIKLFFDLYQISISRCIWIRFREKIRFWSAARGFARPDW